MSPCCVADLHNHHQPMHVLYCQGQPQTRPGSQQYRSMGCQSSHGKKQTQTLLPSVTGRTLTVTHKRQCRQNLPRGGSLRPNTHHAFVCCPAFLIRPKPTGNQSSAVTSSLCPAVPPPTALLTAPHTPPLSFAAGARAPSCIPLRTPGEGTLGSRSTAPLPALTTSRCVPLSCV